MIMLCNQIAELYRQQQEAISVQREIKNKTQYKQAHLHLVFRKRREKNIDVTCVSLAGVKLVQQLHVHYAEVVHGAKDDKLRGESCQANQPAPSTIGKRNNNFGFFVHWFLLAADHFLGRFFSSIAGILLDLQLVWMFP